MPTMLPKVAARAASYRIDPQQLRSRVLGAQILPGSVLEADGPLPFPKEDSEHVFSKSRVFGGEDEEGPQWV
eukprot:9477739-Pyramimonas_sp.AAC.2